MSASLDMNGESVDSKATTAFILCTHICFYGKFLALQHIAYHGRTRSILRRVVAQPHAASQAPRLQVTDQSRTGTANLILLQEWAPMAMQWQQMSHRSFD